jgi:hypothetical protein
MMDLDTEADLRDRCPYCRSTFEIVVVRFSTFSTGLVCSCPNCAIVSADPADSLGSFGTPSIIRGARMIASFNSRFRNIVASVIIAVLAAALLRHAIHVYGGISPAEIRVGAVLGIPAVALVLLILGRHSVR